MLRRTCLLSLLGLSTCSILPTRPYEARRDWPLQVSRPNAVAPNPAGPILLIRRVSAGPGLEARGLQTLQPDGSVAAAIWDEWAVPPAEGVEAALRLWLSQSGVFAAVVGPGSQLRPGFTIEAELTDFIADPQRSQARATLSLVLVRDAGGRSLPVLQREFTGHAALTSRDGAGIAAGLRAALGDVLGQIENSLRATVSA